MRDYSVERRLFDGARRSPGRYGGFSHRPELRAIVVEMYHELRNITGVAGILGIAAQTCQRMLNGVERYPTQKYSRVVRRKGDCLGMVKCFSEDPQSKDVDFTNAPIYKAYGRADAYASVPPHRSRSEGMP